LQECLDIGVQLTTALEHLHGSGLIHRDIKPSNIVFVDGTPKLADVGLVTTLDATRSFVGTEGYTMARAHRRPIFMPWARCFTKSARGV
jgi:serine/threonine protein kinase